ncbi:hypothetical protein EVAR_88492_1 [Eumeta japonica]|uniref:Uncharacterized protein n=1 Tax=Eumeta variegata TaxID=151549 RepID=A0A4C1XTQ3_EUMVA|nr:hypothetical protein EVAR_88492_1 [Eumeta japonica]
MNSGRPIHSTNAERNKQTDHAPPPPFRRNENRSPASRRPAKYDHGRADAVALCTRGKITKKYTRSIPLLLLLSSSDRSKGAITFRTESDYEHTSCHKEPLRKFSRVLLLIYDTRRFSTYASL